MGISPGKQETVSTSLGYHALETRTDQEAGKSLNHVGKGSASEDPHSQFKYRALAKLTVCLSLDLFGDVTLLVLFPLSELVDVFYALPYACALKTLFGSNSLAVVGFVKELLPLADVIPAATLGWCLEVMFPKGALARLFGLPKQELADYEIPRWLLISVVLASGLLLVFIVMMVVSLGQLTVNLQV
eukprot:gnl/MRDRNA2_/MRDRNA2_262211_c0_seq1.p1 gnl/MRDRNA2_/MRDRNA2_262211_c0~~gnl/MRDRNA2_/MRDRNA2_262211_c0_seq1.p1  ORF type:complete len:187 (+),score=23.87 gnl/MRDRNA2_/MRDRNA2_262211_c0_seq1:74-634(+)